MKVKKKIRKERKKKDFLVTASATLAPDGFWLAKESLVLLLFSHANNIK